MRRDRHVKRDEERFEAERDTEIEQKIADVLERAHDGDVVLLAARLPRGILFKEVRDETAGIAGDGGCVFTNADTRRLTGNHPGADDRIIAFERRHFDISLVDEALRA